MASIQLGTCLVDIDRKRFSGSADLTKVHRFDVATSARLGDFANCLCANDIGLLSQELTYLSSTTYLVLVERLANIGWQTYRVAIATGEFFSVPHRRRCDLKPFNVRFDALKARFQAGTDFRGDARGLDSDARQHAEAAWIGNPHPVPGHLAGPTNRLVT